MSLKALPRESLIALSISLCLIAKAQASCGMPNPRASLGEYVYGVAFISGIFSETLVEGGDLRKRSIKEYIEFVLGLNSIVLKFADCFSAKELFEAKQSIRLAAAVWEQYPVDEISEREDVKEILMREKTADMTEYESIRKYYIESLRSGS